MSNVSTNTMAHIPNNSNESLPIDNSSNDWIQKLKNEKSNEKSNLEERIFNYPSNNHTFDSDELESEESDSDDENENPDWYWC